MLSAARSPLISSIIIAMALARTSGSHSRFRHRAAAVAIFGGKRLPDRLQIIAGIKPFRNRADVLAERLAVAQVGRAREHVDLGAGIVDVIFAGDVVACEFKQARQSVTEHRATTMADMHRPGRVGRNIFDVDLLARANNTLAVSIAFTQHRAQRVRPGLRLQGEVDEPWTGDVDRSDQIVRAQFRRDRLGEIARFGPRLLRQYHRGIGRHVAMGGVARRLDHHAREIDAGRPSALRGERVAHRMHARQHVGEQMRRGSLLGHGLDR